MIFIAGSRKFYHEIERLKDELDARGVTALTSGKWESTQEDTMENQRDALLRAFEGLDDADTLYILAKDGYVGKTVAMEAAYAHARGVAIISSEPVEELSVRGLVDEVVPVKDFISSV
ncbi:hypothetical protein KY327_00420 [Candidatus Woesearchaeota archaeon]|nr:hypothetical protein [Candidatus Woesearchaeota archaeon]